MEGGRVASAAAWVRRGAVEASALQTLTLRQRGVGHVVAVRVQHDAVCFLCSLL